MENAESNEAFEIGYDRGWRHANYTNAYGGSLKGLPDIPGRFEKQPLRDRFVSGFTSGVVGWLVDEAEMVDMDSEDDCND